MQKKCKYIVIGTILLMLSTPVWSLQLLDLTFGLQNDWYTLGLGYNNDDGLSFGSTIDAVFNTGFSFNITTEAYTDRTITQSRYDVISFSTIYPLSWSLDRYNFTFTPKVGIMGTGNFGLQDIQNIFHDQMDLNEVHLSYTSDTITVHPLTGATLQLGMGQGSAFYAAEASSLYTHGWEYVLKGNLLFKTGKALSIRLGYTYRTALDQDTDHEHQVDAYKGATVSYNYDGGFFSSDFISYLETGKSYGGFKFNLLAFQEPKTFKKTDFTISTGFFYDILGYQNRIFSYEKENFSFEIRHKTGPMLNHMEVQSDRMNIGSWLFGYTYNYHLFKNLIPYIKFMAGIQRFNLQTNYTTTANETLHPTIALQLGLKGLGMPPVIFGNKQYRLDFGSTVQYVFNTDKITYNQYFSELTGPWLISAGIIIEIDHDLEAN